MTKRLPKPVKSARNGSAPTADRKTTRIKALETECEKLRETLAKVQTERDQYLKALYEEARKNIHFEDLDISDLKAMSAGPVELLE